MPEQQSRRANVVTKSQFEGAWETPLLRFGRSSLNLKDSLDAMEGWARLTNIWHQNEGEATARPGQTSFATGPGGSTIHSVRKLRDPGIGGTDTRIWGIGTSVYRGASGALTSVEASFSGNPLTLLPHRPTLSSDPWMFVGDSSKMRKVRSDGLSLPIGLAVPTVATTALANEYSVSIADFEAGGDTEPGDWTPVAGTDEADNPTDPPDAFIATAGPIANFGVYGIIHPASLTTPTGAYDNWWGVAVTRDLTTLTRVGAGPAPATKPADDNDIVHIWMKIAQPEKIAELRVYVVISAVFDPDYLPGTEVPSSENTDAYVKSFRPNDYVQFVQANTAQVEAAEQARIYALRDKDAHNRAYNDTRPSWEEKRAVSDPDRAPSFQLGTGSHQWFGYGEVGSPLRRGDFQRIGETAGRDWSTVTGLILYARMLPEFADSHVGIGFDDWYITGGSGVDSCEPGAQHFDYRVTNYDPRTGAESNGSPEQEDDRVDDTVQEDAPLDSVRRGIVIDPPSYGDAAVRQRIYRRGGSLIDDWYFVGENTSDGGTFIDDLTDLEIAGAGTLPIDHFQPVPTIDEDGATVLAQPLPALWGPIEGMLLGCGDPYRPGFVYFCVPGQPDHWSSSGYVEVCAPSEELMHGGIAGHQAFVFSRTRLYFLYPNLSGDAGVTAAPALCTRGLLGRWAFCVGPGGVIYFVAEDGVFATQGGPEDWLSEPINPLFYGTAVNGYKPINKAVPTAIRLTTWENDLYFLYQDSDGNRQVMVYSILQKFWRHYSFGRSPACVQGEDEDILVIGGNATGAAYTHDGLSDDSVAIACTVRTGSGSNGVREEKLFGDIFLDADPQLVDLSLQVFLNEETHSNTAIAITSGSAGRQRFLVHAFGESPQKAHSIACQLSWSSATAAPILFQLGFAVTMQPDLTNTRVTNWDDLGSSDEVWLTGITLDCDTGNVAKTIYIERDFDGVKSTVTSFEVTADGRHKFKFSWPALPANMVRIRPDPADCVPWLLYRADWIYQTEPPRISKWDIHFESQWDQYYTGLDLYCDTDGEEKQIEVSVDGVVLTHPHTAEAFWRVTTTGRQVVHLTLPWGRGHVFRFVALDDNPGLLYTHRWHLQAEPSEQSNWNQNFSVLGTRADKWLKAVVLECDTFGLDKSVNIEADGAVVEVLTVNTNGRRVVQIALATQQLGRVWRMFPTDANPGRLYSAEPLFDEEPFQLDRWETQETNHNLPGWFYPLYGHITLKSTAEVTLTVTMHHNQTGGTTTETYTIPSTSGVKQRRFLAGFRAGKGVLIKYTLTSDDPFWLYRDETTIVIQPWGAQDPITVQPFGNDDQDPSRTMTHAVLAAQSSGGAASPGGPA